MNRRQLSIAAAVVILATASCGSKDKPAASPTPGPSSSLPTPSTPPTSPAPAPTPPATAAGITVTSADAFARFYLTAIDHAAATGDVTALRAWSDKGCISCTELIQHYSSIYKAGGSLTGDFRSADAKTSSIRLNGTKAADVTLQFTEGKQVVIPSAGAKPTPYAGGKSTWRLALLNRSGHWIMYEMKQQ